MREEEEKGVSAGLRKEGEEKVVRDCGSRTRTRRRKIKTSIYR